MRNLFKRLKIKKRKSQKGKTPKPQTDVTAPGNLMDCLFSPQEVQQEVHLSRDDIVKLLCTNPEALEAFEKAYEYHALTQSADDFFETNSRQAAEEKHAVDPDAVQTVPTEELAVLQERIVSELLAQTQVICYNGDRSEVQWPDQPALPVTCSMVTNEDVHHLPMNLRPQLTGNLAMRSVDIASAPTLLYFYKRAKEEGEELCYNLFRQGLDILDLDPITYEIIGTNPNSMGYWLPGLVDANNGWGFFKIPETKIVKVPMTLLQMTRLDYGALTETTLKIVDEWAYKAFQLDENKEYFIKTGTYSSKFDFRNAHVHGAKEVRELGEYLLYIHHQAVRMAGFPCQPCIYGVSTTTEWVVREFIHDKENNPCIYKGLPLHTEYRVFVDCDTKQILGISPYWDPDTMKNRFGKAPDSNTVHNKHDYVIYAAHEETLMRRYNENKDAVLKHIQEILPDLNLPGQWSIDVMQNGDDFWLIDMALAENSAFYECVPEDLRRPLEENWIPALPNVEVNEKGEFVHGLPF